MYFCYYLFILIYNSNTYMNEFVANKFNELKYIFSGQSTEIKNLNARFNLWEIIYKNEILYHTIIGQVLAKSMITIADNSFLMSLYRYGLFGMILEMAVLLALFYSFFIKIRYSKKFYIPLFLIVGQLIASITTNVMYEC